MIYLASPYSHPDPVIKKTRFLLVEQCTAALINEGHLVWSPIVHCYEMAKKFTMPDDADFWKAYNFDFIRHCTEMYVLTIDGWTESKGVRMEIELAANILLPVRYVNSEGQFITNFAP
jgi:hypothetical protein